MRWEAPPKEEVAPSRFEEDAVPLTLLYLHRSRLGKKIIASRTCFNYLPLGGLVNG
jgi:hypothetical protein